MPRASLLPILPALGASSPSLLGGLIPASLVLFAAFAGAQDRPVSAGSTRVAIIEAEAARAAAPGQLQWLAATAAAPSALRPLAIRALGRLERADLIDVLLPLLDAEQTAARAEAAWALAQSAGSDAGGAARVREALFQRLVGESDAAVRGAIGEALGRLPAESPAVAGRVEEALVAILSRLEVTSRVDKQAAGGRIVGLTLAPTREALVPMPALIGGLRGLEALARAKGRAKQSFMPDTIARLRSLATDDQATSDARNRSGSRQEEAARARRLATLCLLPTGGVNAELATRLMGDSDVLVRRLAVSAAAADRAAIDRGLKDKAWPVRYQALRAYGRRFQASEGCAPIVDAIRNQTDHVSLLAVDLLGGSCQPDDKAVERLIDLVLQASLGAEAVANAASDAEAVANAALGAEAVANAALGAEAMANAALGAEALANAALGAEALAKAADWRRPAHAIVALAKAAPDRARPYIARFLAGGPWQSRMYSARAAAQVGDVELLRRLAADADDNVREAAIAGLSKTARHEADAVYIAALAAKDFQLVMTAAAALAGSPNRAAAVPALLSALARLTALDADPSRDPRTAILERVQELGSADSAGALRPYLTDVDPQVAGLAAKVLSTWTGTTVEAAPRRRPTAVPRLTDEALQRLAKTIVRVTMSGGGQFEIGLLAELAPVSSALFVDRALRGYYTGLTFHRILPNFLIQGGSPGANEFAGDTRYMIDEPGRTSQSRGTVGTSTRGRDTGDGQIYINLVDTPRLDHEYLIFGEVVRGMDVVDRILEGDVMTKVEVVVR